MKSPSPTYVTVNNVHTVVEAARKSSYQKVLNSSALALADGRPLSLVGRMSGVRRVIRIFGPTFMEKALDWGQDVGLRHFFYGSSNETLDEMKTQMLRRYPRIMIAGMISPPYRQLSHEENDAYLRQINASCPDIIWVGLGAPKQEIWMSENFQKLNRGVMIGIGAGFDYIAGNLRHAPQWMKDYSLEWLFRLLQEPRRLWKRYLVTNTLFVWYVALQLLGLRRFESEK